MHAGELERRSDRERGNLNNVKDGRWQDCTLIRASSALRSVSEALDATMSCIISEG